MRELILIFVLFSPNQKLEEAKRLADIGKYDESILIYQKAIKNLKGYEKIKATLDYIDVLVRAKKLDKALAELSELEDKISSNSILYPEILYRKALIYEDLGDLETAQKYFEKIVLDYENSEVFEEANKGIDRIFEKLNKDYIATVGPLGITYEEFQEFIKDMPPFAKPSPTDTEAIKRVLDNLIDWKLLYLEGLSEKLDLTPEFKKGLEKSKQRIIANLYMKKLNNEIKISEEEIKEYYAKNKDEFKIPDKWDFRKIEVRTKLDASNILKEIKKGKKFEELAQKYSLGPEARMGGLVKNFSEKNFPKEIVDALRTMNENEVKGPIKLSNGNFAIIKLLKKYPGRQKTLDEVRKDIERKLKSRKIANLWMKVKEKLRKKYNVRYFLKGKKIEIPEEEKILIEK